MQFFWGGVLISCSNGSSSSDDDESSYGQKIYSESVTFSAETPEQIVPAETLADLSIKSLTIKVINVNYSGDDWWFDVYSDSSWNNKAKLEWQSGEGSSALYLATITDATAIAAYKANGIYIAGTASATASVSVFYAEGEAEESDDSGEEAWITIKESIDYTGTKELIQIIKNTDISTQQISKLKIILTDYTKQDDDWITASADTEWTNKSENIQNSPDNYEISDSDFISAFLTNGLYIGSTSNLTCKISVYYK